MTKEELFAMTPAQRGALERAFVGQTQGIECKDCQGCLLCRDSQNCVACNLCVGCVSCVSCVSCLGCVRSLLCRDSQNCVACNLCVGCQGCVRCHGCRDSVNCKTCEESQGLQGCVDCSYCTNCVDCLGCRGCKDCIGISYGVERRFVAYGVQLTEEEYKAMKATYRPSTHRGSKVWLAVALGLSIVACLLLARAAFAQPPPATILARAMVAEATWREVDHRGILHVLRRRAGAAQQPIDVMAQRYVSGFRARSARMTWVMSLTPECEEPAGWPTRLSWPVWRPKCLEVFALAQLWLQRPEAVVDPCGGRADQWGARSGEEFTGAVARGWVLLDCGLTSNAFWRERR